MKTSLVIVPLMLGPAALFAAETDAYRCSLDELTRRVEILHEPGVSVPCEVHYYKDAEMAGEHEVLWRATNEAGYCEARAAELVEKLRGMGWTCWAAGQSAATGETQETDDTETLAPAEEEIEIPDSGG